MTEFVAFVAGFAVGLIIGPEYTKVAFNKAREWVAAKLKKE